MIAIHDPIKDKTIDARIKNQEFQLVQSAVYYLQDVRLFMKHLNTQIYDLI